MCKLCVFSSYAGMFTLNDFFQELKKEAKNNKGLLDTLNEVGSAFLELVPWRAREGLDKMITEDNERYRLVSDTIAQKVDEIDAAILRSQQVLKTALWAETVSNLYLDKRCPLIMLPNTCCACATKGYLSRMGLHC